MPPSETDDLVFNPGDGTGVGDGLELMNQLLACTAAPQRRIRVWFGPDYGDAEILQADHNGNLIDPPADLIHLAAPDADIRPLARALADAAKDGTP